MKHSLSIALDQSAVLPEKTIHFQGLEFMSPLKWVIAVIGDLKGLLNIKDLPKAGNTNLLVVFLTDEQPELDMIFRMQSKIRKMCT